MTQLFQNFSETVNTLLFGIKAKNVKTTVKVNEISDKMLPPEVQAELDKAHKQVHEL
jgi:hypothetical protein